MATRTACRLCAQTPARATSGHLALCGQWRHVRSTISMSESSLPVVVFWMYKWQGWSRIFLLSKINLDTIVFLLLTTQNGRTKCFMNFIVHFDSLLNVDKFGNFPFPRLLLDFERMSTRMSYLLIYFKPGCVNLGFLSRSRMYCICKKSILFDIYKPCLTGSEHPKACQRIKIVYTTILPEYFTSWFYMLMRLLLMQYKHWWINVSMYYR